MPMQLKDIKRMYRLYMNGIVSQSMRAKGAEYRVNFGLTVPLLRRLAEQIPPSLSIAQELWADRGVRESLLLAPMVCPVEEFTYELAHQWVDEMPNAEVADFCCKYLFARLAFAPQLATEWIVSDSDITVYTGYRLAHSLLEQEPDVQWVCGIADSAITALAGGIPVAVVSAQRFLTEALIHPTYACHVAEILRHTDRLDADLRCRLIALSE